MGVEICLRDGPFAGTRVGLDQAQLPNTLLLPDPPLPQAAIAAHGPHGFPPVPMAVYELAVELIDPDGRREGDYHFHGHRLPDGQLIRAA